MTKKKPPRYTQTELFAVKRDPTMSPWATPTYRRRTLSVPAISDTPIYDAVAAEHQYLPVGR